MLSFFKENFCIITPLTPEQVVNRLEPQVSPSLWGIDLKAQYYPSPDDPLFAGDVDTNTFYIWRTGFARRMGYRSTSLDPRFRGVIQPHLTGSKINIEAAVRRYRILAYNFVGIISGSLMVYVNGFKPVLIIGFLSFFVLSFVMINNAFNIFCKRTKADLLALFGGTLEENIPV